MNGGAGDEGRVDVVESRGINDDGIGSLGGGLFLECILPGLAGVRLDFVSGDGAELGVVGLGSAEEDGDVGGAGDLRGAGACVVIGRLAAGDERNAEYGTTYFWNNAFHSYGELRNSCFPIDAFRTVGISLKKRPLAMSIQLLWWRSGFALVTDGGAGDEHGVDVIEAHHVDDDGIGPGGGGLCLKFFLPNLAGVVAQAGVLMRPICRDATDDVIRLFGRAEEQRDAGGNVHLAVLVIRRLAPGEESDGKKSAANL